MGEPVASLMMYARPELAEANARFWALIRENLRSAGICAPEYLSQKAGEFDVWENPQLVLSQTCGMPYRLWLHDKVSYVGTPDYGLEGCPAGYYRSPLIVRADDPRSELGAFRKAIFAYNALFSQSGYAAPYNHMGAHGFWFENRFETGAHLASAKAVATGEADIASLDAVTWRLICRYEGFAQSLRVLDWTAATPGLPLITAFGDRTEDVFQAASGAIDALDPSDRDALGIRGLARIPKEAYLQVPNPPEDYSRP